MTNEPGSVEGSTMAEPLRTAKEQMKWLKLEVAQGKETPTKYLEPEAHEDALKTETELWKEGMKLLGKDPYCQIETPEHVLWSIYAKEYAQKMDHGQKDVEFVISGPINTHIETVNGENIEYSNNKDYTIAPTGVVLVERNRAKLARRDAYALPGARRAPQGLGLEKTEMGRDEINDVLRVLQTRVAHYPNQG